MVLTRLKLPTHITSEIIQKINGILYFGGNELAVIGSQFVVKPIGSKVAVQVPQIKSIDREYIKSISNRAMQDVEQQNCDSAITKSRTLLGKHFVMLLRRKATLLPIVVTLQNCINRCELFTICTPMAIPTDESTLYFLDSTALYLQ